MQKKNKYKTNGQNMKICFLGNLNLHKEIFLFFYSRITKGADKAKRFCNSIKLSNVEPGIKILTKSSNHHVKNSSREVKEQESRQGKEHNSPEEIITPKALPKDA